MIDQSLNARLELQIELQAPLVPTASIIRPEFGEVEKDEHELGNDDACQRLPTFHPRSVYRRPTTTSLFGPREARPFTSIA